MQYKKKPKNIAYIFHPLQAGGYFLLLFLFLERYSIHKSSIESGYIFSDVGKGITI